MTELEQLALQSHVPPARVLPRHLHHQRGKDVVEHGPVGPVHARSWVGAAQDGDFVAQHEELDVLGGGRAAHQQDQSEHL